MRRFYIPNTTLQVGQQLLLPREVHHHWTVVLRATVGMQAMLFNGQGGEYLVTLTAVSKASSTVSVYTYNPINRCNAYRTHLGLVMSKGERMDYALQKATELGVTSIQLLSSNRGEVQLKYPREQNKLEHWQGVLAAACEQCGLNVLPQLHSPIALEKWLASVQLQLANPDSLGLVLSPAHTPLPASHFNKSDYYLLVGPEGGLGSAEMTAAGLAGLLPWQLGERVYRTETAPVAALATIAAWHNNP